MEVLFTLLAERYERGSIILTSNLPFSKWEKIFKDPMTTAAAIDRLVHHSIILEPVASYPLEQSKKNKARPRRQKTGKRNDPPQESTKRPRESPQLVAWSIPQVPPFWSLRGGPRMARLRSGPPPPGADKEASFCCTMEEDKLGILIVVDREK